MDGKAPILQARTGHMYIYALLRRLLRLYLVLLVVFPTWVLALELPPFVNLTSLYTRRAEVLANTKDAALAFFLFPDVLLQSPVKNSPALYLNRNNARGMGVDIEAEIIDPIVSEILSTRGGRTFCAAIGNAPEQIAIYFGVSGRAAKALSQSRCFLPGHDIYIGRTSKLLRKDFHIIYVDGGVRRPVDSWTQFNMNSMRDVYNTILRLKNSSTGSTRLKYERDLSILAMIRQQSGGAWPQTTNQTVIFLNPRSANWAHIAKVIVHEAAISADGRFHAGDRAWWESAKDKILFYHGNRKIESSSELATLMSGMSHPLVQYTFAQIRAYRVEREIITELFGDSATDEYRLIGIRDDLPCLEQAGNVMRQSKNLASSISVNELLSSIDGIRVNVNHIDDGVSLCEYLSTPQITTRNTASARGPRTVTGGDH